MMTKLNSLLLIIPLLMTAIQAYGEPVETYVEAAGPAGPLKGVMLSPDAPPGPVVLIIPGSGPTVLVDADLAVCKPAMLS